VDREEFYRLKKVSGKKHRDVAAADAELEAARKREAQKESEDAAEAPNVPDILGDKEDTDVIF
jgi:V-type H+-transporting ATPase subunit D